MAPHTHARPREGRRPAALLLRLLAVAGLAVDAAVHARLADRYDAIGDSISQGTLFRAEAAAASLAALFLLLGRRRSAVLFGWLVAASGLGALLLYRYVDVGTLGPLPNMYEPIWFADKTLAAWAEGVATAALTVLLLLGFRRRRQGPEEPA
ncbi:hypothetical protein ACIQWA_30025 [Kitasatospora sp. NPDC098652]|uniref:hypothetical protein n=1 Tax=Kitasatospora sp. NPDC098652 TaxID=3364095 RepID=UPI0037F3A738